MNSGLRAGEIDRLKTKRDVEQFVWKTFPALKKEALFAAAAEDTHALADGYFKLDLDGNGLTDLVVNGRYTIVVLDVGGHYTVFNMGRAGGDPGLFEELLAIDSVGHPNKLVVRRRKGVYWRDLKPPEYHNDTLVIHFGQLMEYNAHPDEGFRFERIRILTTRCFGHCPLFDMTIRSNRWTTYEAVEYNKQKGSFACFLPAPAYDTLMAILRYMPIDRMDTAFLVNWTDDQTVIVTFFFNGRARQIGDYGKLGTYGLQRLYALIFRWKDELEWKENQ